MNKQELEKLFDEKVTNMRIFDEYKNDITYKVKQFIFETIIPEVLKSMLKEDKNTPLWEWLWFKAQQTIKQKAKELYNLIN